MEFLQRNIEPNTGYNHSSLKEYLYYIKNHVETHELISVSLVIRFTIALSLQNVFPYNDYTSPNKK